MIIVLSKPIWPEGFFDVICPGCLIPEFWVTTYPAGKESREMRPLHGIIGFACGSKAEQLSCMPDSAKIRASLAQLDEIFGEEQHRLCDASCNVCIREII